MNDFLPFCLLRRVQNEDEDPESQEVLEDQLVRLLTREYIELLGMIFI